MKIKVLFSLLLLYAGPLLIAQLPGSDYEKVNSVARKVNSHHTLAFYLIRSQDKSQLAIGYDLKPAKFEVYDTNSWQRTGAFSIKGHVSDIDSYFSGTEANTIHIAKSIGRKMYKANFKTAEVIPYKLRKSQASCKSCLLDDKFYTQYWKQTGRMDQYFYFEDYALIVTDTTLEVYRKK